MSLGSSVCVGDIVMISSFGTQKFITCRGWYTYKGMRRSGWYFKSISGNSIVPEFEVDSNDVTVVVSSGSGNADCGCGSDCCKPTPAPMPNPGSCDCRNPMKDNVDGAFTTVDTVEERNKICFPYAPDGKIVRVNDVKGEVRYYIWDAEQFKWNDFEFPTSKETVDRIVLVENDIKDTNEEVSRVNQEVQKAKQEIEKTKETVTKVVDNANWMILED